MKSKDIITCCILVVVSLLCSLSLADDHEVVNVTMTVIGNVTFAETDESFVCAILDCWWPANKRENKILMNAVKEFRRLRIKIDFSTDCLDMHRWDRMNKFFIKTGAVITYGLKNALNWNFTNAYEFMNYTAYKRYKIDSYELGNELSGGARVDAKKYANDAIVLKYLTKSLYPDPTTRPKVVGPGGVYDKIWFNTFFRITGGQNDSVDSVTYHFYNLGSGIVDRILNPYVVDEASDSYYNIKTEIQALGLRPWVSDSGGGNNSSSKKISHSFANMFWYLNQLGLASKYNHTIFCRQTLGGGNYGLLNSITFMPNPDYYGALLFNRLMGKKVLFAFHISSKYLRVYAHCSRNNNKGVSVLIINMSNSKSFNVQVSDSLKSYPLEDAKPRIEYHLTPKGGNILSKTVLLNKKPLKLTKKSDIPKLSARYVNPTIPIRVAPHSIVFASITDYNAPACAN